MDKRIKIGIVSPFNPFEVREYIDKKYSKFIYNNNTMATSVHALVIGFLKLKCHVVVFTYDLSLNKEIEYHGDLLDIYAIPLKFYNKKIGVTSLFRRLYMGFYLSKLIRKHIGEFSILHAQWTYDFAKACIPFSLDLPVFCTVRDWCPYIISTIDKFSSKLFWINSKIVFKEVISSKNIHFVANSFYTYALINKNIIEDPPILFNPIKEDFVNKKRMLYPKKHIFISIANNLSDRRKNINNLIIAFGKYKDFHPDSELWLVGYYNELLSKIGNDLMTSGIKFYGIVTHDELKIMLDNSSVLVHPSYEETFGNIVLEAMARGVPVIGGEHSGAIPFLLGNGKYGCLCDVSDPNSIYTSMVKVMNDDDYRKLIIANSFEYLLENFLDYKIAQKHIDLYKKYLL